jgi:tyrosine-protein phosphatase YwqE
MGNWFSSLFSSALKADYSALGTDFHSHLIPGIDDGVQTMDEAIYYIQEMMKLGYRKIITTPHIMPGAHDNNAEIILGGLVKLKAELKARNIDIPVEAAAEYYLDDYLFDLVAKKDILTFGNNNFLLELPTFSEPIRFKEFMFVANSMGYHPILAHVERYTYMHDNRLKDYEDIYHSEVGLQVNIGSLAGFYGDQLQKVSFKLIEMGLVDYLSSDLHNERHLVYLKQGLKNKQFVKVLKEKTFRNAEL